MSKDLDDQMIGFMVRYGHDVVYWDGLALTAYSLIVRPVYARDYQRTSLEPLSFYKLEEGAHRNDWDELESILPAGQHWLVARNRMLKRQWKREHG